MTSSTDVAATQSAVPALAPTPATTITFEDIAPPTLYMAQKSSGAVDAGLANYGDLFIAQGAEDGEAEVVWETDSDAEGVLFYPLHMYKTWTWSDGNDLKFWDYGDGTPPAEATQLAEESGKKVFRTYNYVLFVPDYDEEMPVNFRLNSKSQRPAANKINLTVSRSGRPMHASAFRVTTVKKSNGANKWTVPIVTEVEADEAQVAKAGALFELISPGLAARATQRGAQTNQPAI